MFDPNKIRGDFPILQQIHPETSQPIVYLDSAATSQKPSVVIEAISDYYLSSNANVHRGIHLLSEKSTQVFEDSRSTIAEFFGATNDELILTRNTTEAINGAVYGWGEKHVGKGDRVLVSLLEHHSNFVPWQQLCLRKEAKFEVIPVDESGSIDLGWLEQKLDERVKVVSISQVSNVLGSVQDIDKIARLVHGVGGKLVVDAAQSAPHLPTAFDRSQVDFFAFSGHKMLAPMGVGGLLDKHELLESGEMTPWLFGGGMIGEVGVELTSFNQDLSERFTAGTPDVASVVGLAAACEYLQKLGMENVAEHDRELVKYALGRLQEIEEVKLIGPLTDRIGSVAFLYEGVHAHDVAQVLESQGIAVRAGHHCAMPLHTHFGWPATVRASFQVYSTKEDVEALIAGLNKVKQVFR